MRLRRLRLPQTIAAVTALAVMTALLLHPDRYLRAVSDGVLLWATCVLPSLLPFMLLTRIVAGLGTPPGVSKRLSPAAHALFGVSGIGGGIFLLGVVSGYPVGAKLVADAVASGGVSREEGKRLALFCSCGAPLFIVGSMGTALLHAPAVGWTVYAGHALAAVLCGVLFSKLPGLRRKNKCTAAAKPVLAPPKIDLFALTQSTVLSVLGVGLWVSVFYMASDMLMDVGLFSGGTMLSAALMGLVEVTRGTAMLAPFVAASPRAVAAVAAGLVSFSGVCIHIQTLAFLLPAGVKPLPYLAAKAAHAVLAAAVTYPLALLFLR
ncbi:MAG: hypothetical protein LBM78_04150 [Clostridiales bacterium]|jgi:sporulation integral membrane protein YlbJ|nr:hypothetical protein [Clostridiales bacterium]